MTQTRKPRRGTPREPNPVCSIDAGPEEVAQSVFLRIRALPHVPVSVFVRDGEVFVLSQRYLVSAAWDALYPESFAGTFTRMERPHQIARKLKLPEPEPV